MHLLDHRNQYQIKMASLPVSNVVAQLPKLRLLVTEESVLTGASSIHCQECVIVTGQRTLSIQCHIVIFVRAAAMW